MPGPARIPLQRLQSRDHRLCRCESPGVYAAELVALLNAALKAQKDADKAHADQVKFAKKAMDAAKAASAHTAETKEKADKAKEAAKNAKEDIEKKKTLIEDAKKRQEGHKKDIEDAEKDADAAKDKVSWAHCVWARCDTEQQRTDTFSR